MPIKKLKKWFSIKYDSIKQCVAWMPILWKDRDWDRCYLYIVMKFKISRMRKTLERCEVHLSHADDIRRMKIVEELLDRSINNDYDPLEYADKNKCTCPDPDYTFEPQKNGRCSVFVSLKCDYCSERFKYWVRKNDLKEQSDKHYLFKILEKYSNHWWC